MPTTNTSNYQVTTEMTFDGLTESTFEEVKTDLTNSVANALGVAYSAVELNIKNQRRRKRSVGSNGIVVDVTITTMDLKAISDIKNSINSGTFESALNGEIQNSPSLNDKGFSLTGVSQAITSNEGKLYSSSFYSNNHPEDREKLCQNS